MCQSLLADTNLKVKLGEAVSDPFETTIGTPQGDGLSPILFAIYLECALREVRKQCEAQRPVSDSGLPLEALYADDSDFISLSPSFLQFLEALIPPTIDRYKLKANATKWERTALAAGDNNEWRKTKKLGSLLGDDEDIERRKALATASFKSLRLLWERKKLTSVSTRMRAYNALVLPVLLYNCGTWGVTDAVIDKLEVFHRRQLREVLGVKTRDIHNVDLYKRCNTSQLKGRITHARWSLFGHVLRLARDTPAQLAMDYYTQVEVSDRGRPITTLPVVLFNEYKKYKIMTINDKRRVDKKPEMKTYQRSTSQMLVELRGLAGDRVEWRNVVAKIAGFD